MSEDVNYERVLADAEAQIMELQAVAAFARRMLGRPAEAVSTVTGSPAGTINPREIPSDAFFGLGVGEAIKKYLSIVKQTRGVQDIVDAIQRGGLPTQAKNLYGTVYTALKRGQPKTFSKVKKEWGLTEWYK